MLLTILLFCSLVALDFAFDGMNIMAYRQVGLGIIFYEIGAVVVRCNVLALIDAHKWVLLLCVPLGLVSAIINGGVSIYAWHVRNAFLLLVSATCLSWTVMWSASKFRAIGMLSLRAGGMMLLCSHFYLMYFWRRIFACDLALRHNFFFATASAAAVFCAYMLAGSLIAKRRILKFSHH